MAGGKLSPRQKMVNLMYLVFIAMLALNMSKEVLTAFGLMNKKFEISNQKATTTNSSLKDQIAQKAQDDPTNFDGPKKIFDEVSAATDKFYKYLETLKTDLSSDYERNEKGDLPYEAMDKGDKADEWFTGDRYSQKGDEIIKEFANYRTTVTKALAKNKKAKSLISDVELYFNTNDVTDKEGITKKYLDYHYKGFPGIASIAKLSNLQFDLKTLEANLFYVLVGATASAQASYSNYQAIVIADKSAFFAGEPFKGRVVLGRYDNSTVPTAVEVNGRKLDLNDAVKDGQVNLSFQTGNVGEHDINGKFTFMEEGKPVSIDIKGNYVVVPKPNSATISADKMNSVYRGVTNPMTVSFAGISDNNVNASAPGLTKGAKTGQYNWNVTNVAGNKAVLTVTGKLPDGSNVSDRKEFIIRDIPRPSATIRGELERMKGSKNDLKVSTVGVAFPDFVFDVKVTVQSFEIKCPGSPTIIVQGNKINDVAAKAIDKAQKGDVIAISQITTKLEGAGNYRMPPSGSFLWEVQ